jgi:hypothetical protein
MNTEYYLGSAASEAAQFRAFGEQMQKLQQEVAAKQGTHVMRGFHAKGHACLEGSIIPLAGREARTRFGIFASNKTRPVKVRFSNAVGWHGPDSEVDARGFAVKVLGIQEPTLLDEPGSQDFLMTNSMTPVGKDAVEFMEFAHANAKGMLHNVLFLLRHPGSAGPALTSTGPVDSAVTTTYYSGGAYHWGAHQAVKFASGPCDPALVRKPSKDSPDYLREDLVAAAAEGVCMRLYVQFQTDPNITPIEDAAHTWTTDVSPLVPVADIHLPPQDLAHADAAACEALRFQPWHATKAHQPMGHINRARRVVYAASQAERALKP